jgi:hypothetical protein
MYRRAKILKLTENVLYRRNFNSDTICVVQSQIKDDKMLFLEQNFYADTISIVQQTV